MIGSEVLHDKRGQLVVLLLMKSEELIYHLGLILSLDPDHLRGLE